MKKYVLFGALLALASLAQAQKRTAFEPGKTWPDNKGTHLNAHSGGLLYDKGRYYLYGEYKVAGSAGNAAQVGGRRASRRRGSSLCPARATSSDAARGRVHARLPGLYWQVKCCRASEPQRGPALCKKDGKYYLITSGCTGWELNAARSFVASSIWGP